jgi:tetratricopeptide (TPR) repeat protein
MKYLFSICLSLVLTFGFSQDFKFYKLKGDSALDDRKFELALKNYKLALKAKPERLLQTEEEIDIYINLCYAHTELAEYKAAIEHCFKALEKDAVKNNPKLTANLYNKLGVNYHYLGEQNLALEFYEKCTKLVGIDSAKLGAVYNNMANIYQQLNQLEKAKEYYKSSLDIFNAENHYEGKVAVSMNIGIIELQNNNLESAFNYTKNAEALAKEKKDTLNLIAVYVNLADYYVKISDFNMSEEYLETSLKLSKKFKSRMLIAETYKSFVNLYKTKKDFKKAFEYLVISTNLNDSIDILNNNREYAELQAKYQLKEKEKENELLRQEQAFRKTQVESQTKYIRLLLGLSTLALAFVIMFIYQRIKRNKARKLLVEQNKKIKKSKKQLEDLNFQYEKLIQKYEGS